MNHNNGKPKDSAVRDGFFNTPCTMPVPIQNAPRSEGGVGHDSAILWGSAHFVYVIAAPLLACNSPASPRPIQRKRAGRERPPLFCRCIGKRGGGVGAGFGALPTHPLFWGSLPSN